MIIIAEICIIINDISRLGHQIVLQEILAEMLLQEVCTSRDLSIQRFLENVRIYL